MRARNRRDTTHTMPLELERGSSTVEYEVVFSVTPGEKGTHRTSDCGGTPGCAASVEEWSVFYVHRPKKGPATREERPELENLVTEEELLEYAGANEDYERSGGYGGPDPDDENDRKRDARFED